MTTQGVHSAEMLEDNITERGQATDIPSAVAHTLISPEGLEKWPPHLRPLVIEFLQMVEETTCLPPPPCPPPPPMVCGTARRLRLARSKKR